MKANRFWRRMAALLFSLILCAVCAATPAFAQESAGGQTASLTVYFGDGQEGFSGATFNLYRVGDVSETGTFTLSGSFSDYPVELEGLDSSGWRALAQTLEAYAAWKQTPPTQTQITGADGRAVFADCPAGLYLVSGETYTESGYTYVSEPMAVCLPGLTEEGERDYAVEVSCKFDQHGPDTGSTKRKVLKIWEDSGNEEKRPHSIVVQLLENGKIVDTATLSEENNWEYIWENLDGSSRWQILEDRVPEGYTVSAEQEGTTFVITNTYPAGPTPGADISGEIPYTGMTWWPVPAFVCGGLLLVILGVFIRRRAGEH